MQHRCQMGVGYILFLCIGIWAYTRLGPFACVGATRKSAPPDPGAGAATRQSLENDARMCRIGLEICSITVQTALKILSFSGRTCIENGADFLTLHVVLRKSSCVCAVRRRVDHENSTCAHVCEGDWLTKSEIKDVLDLLQPLSRFRGS